MHKMIPSNEDTDYLRNFSSIFHDPDEAEQYLYDFWERTQIVLEWLKRLQQEGIQKILEMGANPYYLTLLLKKHFNFDLTLANYFGDPAKNGQGTDIVEGAGERHEFHFSHFNMEKDSFPFENEKFDCVLFCEILEHLLLDPGFALTEMHRVIRPGGYLLLTTPNATKYGNMVKMIRGENIYDDYSPHGIYGRHNREYTLAETMKLIQKNQFKIIETRTHDLCRHRWKARILKSLRPDVWRDHIFILACK